MNVMRRFFAASARVAVLTAIAVAASGVALAWTGPTGSPPANNVSAPLNISATGQTKTGALTINGLLSALGNLTAPTITATSQFCLGASCISAWPAGGGGTLGGSGSTNYIAKFTGASSLGNSRISDNGVGIAVAASGAGWAGNFSGSSYGVYAQSTAGQAVYGAATGGGWGGYFTSNAANGLYASGAGSSAYLGYAGYGGYFTGASYGLYALGNGSAYIGYGGYGLYTGNNVYANDYYIASVGRWASQIANGGASYSGGPAYGASCAAGYALTNVLAYDCGYYIKCHNFTCQQF